MEIDGAYVSVVIPTRDRKATLERCLEAFRAQTVPVDRFELVVVDDGSTDGTRETLVRIARGMPNLRCLSQAPGGPAKARNAGIREAKGPLVLFTGDDCIPSPVLIEEHLRSHARDRGIAVLGRIEWHPDLEVTPFMEYVGRTFQFTYPLIEKRPHSVPFGFFYTSNISLPKEALLAAGLFDEEFAEAVCEDAELGYRLSRNGIRIVYNRRALTHHCHAVTLEGYIQRQIRQGLAAALLHRKHPELAGMLGMEKTVSPDTREAFYSAVLTYYSAVGMQEGLAGEGAHGGKEPAIPLEDALKNWSAQVADRLLLRLRAAEEQAKTLRIDDERREAELNALRERSAALETVRAALERELAEHRAFAAKVKASLPYRAYKAVSVFLGQRGGGPPGAAPAS